MERKIQDLLISKSHQIEFPSLRSPYLRAILSILARHYGLRIISIEDTSVFVGKITFGTLSSIAPADNTTDDYKFTKTSNNLSSQSGGISFSSLDEPKMRVRTSVKTDEVYYKTKCAQPPMIEQDHMEASYFQDHPMAYQKSIAQPQLMQATERVSQLALPPYDATISPYFAGNPLDNPSVSYMQELIPPSAQALNIESIPAFPESEEEFFQDLIPSQPPQLDPNRPSAQSAVLSPPYEASTAGSSLPPLDLHGPNVLPFTLSPHFHSHNRANSTFKQFSVPLPRQMQPSPEAAQWPSTNTAFQDEVNIPRQWGDDEMGPTGSVMLNVKQSMQAFISKRNQRLGKMSNNQCGDP